MGIGVNAIEAGAANGEGNALSGERSDVARRIDADRQSARDGEPALGEVEREIPGLYLPERRALTHLVAIVLFMHIV